MTKTIAFKKLDPAKAPVTPDAWIAEGAKAEGKEIPPAPAEKPRKMVRFTLDVDSELHSRMKVACAMKGEKMSDALRLVLEREFPAP